jgi:hypothetical protein
MNQFSETSAWLLMVFNITFTSSSVISWQSALLVKETGRTENITDKLYHIVLFRLSGIQTHNVSGDMH